MEPEPVVEADAEPQPERALIPVPMPDAPPSPAAHEWGPADVPAASGARMVFGRPSAQRMAHMPLRGPDLEDEEAEEPLRGTLVPVLRHSTERARYPVPTTPAIRPPLTGAATVTSPEPPSWEQALAGDGDAGGKRRGRRVSKPRHESGGTREYMPKPPPDRSLTLLVTAMLLVLLALVGIAVWAFWSRATGSVGSIGPGARAAASASVGGP